MIFSVDLMVLNQHSVVERSVEHLRGLHFYSVIVDALRVGSLK